jgi:hypothetical protein
LPSLPAQAIDDERIIVAIKIRARKLKLTQPHSGFMGYFADA